MAGLKKRPVWAPVCMMWLGISLAACGGVDPGQARQAVPSTGGVHSYQTPERVQWNASLEDLCRGAIPPELVAAEAEAVDRFNALFFLEAGDQVTLTTRPGAQDGKRAVALVCGHEEPAAFSQGRTVTVSSGLMGLLRDMAQARVAQRGVTGWENGDPAGELFQSALAFVTYHELGHVFLGHTLPARVWLDGADGGAQEMRADQFAVSVLRGAGYSMEGVDLVFEALEKINPGGSIGHPASRLRFSAAFGS